MLADRLKEARKNKKLTQGELAQKVGATKSTISNYENSYSTPSNRMLWNLSSALDVSTDYLIGKTKFPQGFVADFSMLLPIEDPSFNWKNYDQDLDPEKVQELRTQVQAFESGRKAFEQEIAIPIFVDDDNNVKVQVYKESEYLNEEDTELLNAMIKGFLFGKKFVPIDSKND